MLEGYFDTKMNFDKKVTIKLKTQRKLVSLQLFGRFRRMVIVRRAYSEWTEELREETLIGGARHVEIGTI